MATRASSPRCGRLLPSRSCVDDLVEALVLAGHVGRRRRAYYVTDGRPPSRAWAALLGLRRRRRPGPAIALRLPARREARHGHRAPPAGWHKLRGCRRVGLRRRRIRAELGYAAGRARDVSRRRCLVSSARMAMKHGARSRPSPLAWRGAGVARRAAGRAPEPARDVDRALVESHLLRPRPRRRARRRAVRKAQAQRILPSGAQLARPRPEARGDVVFSRTRATTSTASALLPLELSSCSRCGPSAS